MPLVALVAGLLLVLCGGVLLCALTARVEHFWDTRRSPVIPAHPALPALPAIPPFLTSLDQCIDCGMESRYPDGSIKEPLNLERRCLDCHQTFHLRRPA